MATFKQLSRLNFNEAYRTERYRSGCAGKTPMIFNDVEKKPSSSSALAYDWYCCEGMPKPAAKTDFASIGASCERAAAAFGTALPWSIGSLVVARSAATKILNRMVRRGLGDALGLGLQHRRLCTIASLGQWLRPRAED